MKDINYAFKLAYNYAEEIGDLKKEIAKVIVAYCDLFEDKEADPKWDEEKWLKSRDRKKLDRFILKKLKKIERLEKIQKVFQEHSKYWYNDPTEVPKHIIEGK